MSLHQNSKSQTDEKRMYLAGWEAKFNGDAQCDKFIKTQVVDKSTAQKIDFAIELVFKHNKLVQAFDYEEGSRKKRSLDASELGFNFIERKPHQIYQLTESDHSESYLGGVPPDEFKMPKFDFNAPFQYLGKLAKSDPAFSWLPFDLHLIAPIYLDFYGLYIDYSDPNHPIVLDSEELKETGTAYDDLKPDSEIIFKKTFIESLKSDEFGYDYGNSGVPAWIQYPDIPNCPKTKKPMKFLCQLSGGPAVEKSNMIHKEEAFKQYFEDMNFWIDGFLYIFFDPESKIACYFIQNS